MVDILGNYINCLQFFFLDLFGKPLAYSPPGTILQSLVGYSKYMATFTASPWSQGKRRQKQEAQLEKRLQTLDLVLKILVPAALLLCLVLSIKFGSFNGYLQLMSRQSFATPLMALGAGFTLAYLAFQVVRTILWWRYKPYPLSPGQLPRVTIIVPAYNEGAMVEKALYSAAASDYPADRLEIICIDDGSKDDTWFYIDRARQRHPDLIKAIRFPQNRGKKEGLYAGFTRGKGDFFVTIDSDSIITRRSRYRTAFQLAPVRDLLLLDESNPKSPAFYVGASRKKAEPSECLCLWCRKNLRYIKRFFSYVLLPVQQGQSRKGSWWLVPGPVPCCHH